MKINDKKKKIQIKISNLGKVADATIDLKSLNIFIGPNNTGKTWSAYAIYSIFHENFIEEIMDMTLSKTDVKTHIEKLAKELIIQKKVNIDFNYIFDQIKIDEHLDTPYFKKYFSDFMCEPEKFNKLKIHLEYEGNLRDEFYKLKTNIPRIPSPFVENKEKTNLFEMSFSKEKGSNEIIMILYADQPQDLLSDKDYMKGIEITIRNIINIFTITTFKDFFYKRLFIFPSERNALTYMGEEVVFSKYEEGLKQYIKKSKSYSNIPRPISDHILLIKQIKKRYGYERAITNKKISELSYLIEKDILSGKVMISKDKLYPKSIGFKFGDKEEDKLGISSSSSIVKGLAIFDLYLQYMANEGDLVVIDEPEMNLHPEAQVKLIEFICILVNRGIKFIITTHTPYIVDHLINLVKAKDSRKESVEEKFFLKNKEAFLSPDQLGVYFFSDEGKVRSIFDEKERTIDWRTFGEVSQKISDIYFEL